MIKLYIFESVDQVLAFEVGPNSIEVKVPNETKDEEQPKAARKHKKRKSAKHSAEKERIIAKAKHRGAVTTVRRCKKCGEPGHRSDTCPNDTTSTAITDEQIAYIKEQAEAGASVEEIAAETGLPPKVVRRHW